MCSGPVSTITECGPITGATGEFAAPDGATSGDAVNAVFTASGSLTSTSCIPLGKNVSVNHSPSVRAHRSINHVGAIAQASVCTNGGMRGPGGSPRPLPRAGALSAPEDAGDELGALDEVAVATPTR